MDTAKRDKRLSVVAPTLESRSTPPAPVLAWAERLLVDQSHSVTFKNATTGYKDEEIFGSDVAPDKALQARDGGGLVKRRL